MIYLYQGNKRLAPLDKWPRISQLKDTLAARYPDGGAFSVREFTRINGQTPRLLRKEDIIIPPQFVRAERADVEVQPPPQAVYQAPQQPSPAPLAGDQYSELERIMSLVDKLIAPRLERLQLDYAREIDELRRRVAAMEEMIDELIDGDLDNAESSTDSELLKTILEHIKAGKSSSSIFDSAGPAA